MNPKISLGDCLAFGWRAFTKRPLVYIMAALLVNALWILTEYIDVVFLVPPTAINDALMLMLSLLSGVVYAVVMTSFMLRAHDAPGAVGFNDIFRPRHFWKLMGALILSGLIIFVGILALIIPGLILLAVFSFAGYLAEDKGMNPWPALKESARLSKGNRSRLFLLGVLTMASVVPYLIIWFFTTEPIARVVEFALDLVVLPVTGLAFVHAYRLLEQTKVAETADA